MAHVGHISSWREHLYAWVAVAEEGAELTPQARRLACGLGGLRAQGDYGRRHIRDEIKHFVQSAGLENPEGFRMDFAELQGTALLLQDAPQRDQLGQKDAVE